MGSRPVQSLGAAVAAQLALLGAAFSYACAGVFGRRFRRWGVTPVEVAAGQTTTAAILIAPLALSTGQAGRLLSASGGTWAALFVLAAICTAFAYLLYFRLLATAGAVNLLLVTLLVPVSAIALGTVFLGESLAARHLIGIAAIGAGLAVIDGRPVLWIRRRRSAP